MNVYRLSSWTHRQPGVAANFRAHPPGTHAVVIAIGNIPKDATLTEELLAEMLAAAGLALAPGAEISRKRI